MADKKITHIEALLSAIDNMQIACEPTDHAVLGQPAWGGVDSNGDISRWACLDLPARFTTIQLTGGTTVGDTGVLVHDASGNITGDSDLYDSIAIPDGEIAYGNVTNDGLESDSDFTWDDSLQSLRAGTNCSATGTHALAQGDQADASGNYAEARGIAVTAAGGASRVLGASSSTDKDYSDVRGNGVIGVWPGASHFGGDQVNGNNSSQCMMEMQLVARTTDATQTTMLFDLNDSYSPLYIPDECHQIYKVWLTASQDNSGDALEGVKTWEFHIFALRTDPDLNVYRVETAPTVIESRGDSSWTSGIGFTVDEDSTNYAANIKVTGLASQTINWIATVIMAQQVKTSFYVSGTGG